MKKLMLITTLSLALPVAHAEPPAAYGEPPAAYGQQPAGSAPAVAPSTSAAFSQIDTDQDGMISKQEASSFSAVEVIFDDADANKDGALDAGEFSRTQR